MDDSYPTVSLDQFWTRVALPFFLFVLGFGLLVLFRLGAVQTATSTTVLSTIATLRERPVYVRERGKVVGTAVSAATK